MLALIPPDDPERAHRRWPLERPAVWEAMKAAGSDLTPVLPSHISRNAVRLGTVRDDFLTIVFLATAMRRAAVALTEMRTLLRGRSAESLKDDKEFGKARRRLEETLAAVVANTQSQFGDPWDALVLEAASGSTARLQAIVVSTALSKSFEAGELAPERAMRGLVAEAPEVKAIAWIRRAAPDLRATRNEPEARRAVWGRQLPVVEGPLEKIFSEHLPAALAAAKARGDRLRIMFTRTAASPTKPAGCACRWRETRSGRATASTRSTSSGKLASARRSPTCWAASSDGGRDLKASATSPTPQSSGACASAAGRFGGR